MREVHIIGEPPTATKVSDRPQQRWQAVPVTARPQRQDPISVILRVRNGAWTFNETTTIPPSAANITYHRDPDDPGVPVVLPPVASLPRVATISLHNLPIRSISDIGNIDEYRPIIRSISFIDCPSLVLDDLSWFVPMAAVDFTPAQRRPASLAISVMLARCQIRSLAGMEMFQRAVNLRVEDCGLDLGKEIEIIESYKAAHGWAAGTMGIGGNFIGGRKVLKRKEMLTVTAITYIRQWMAKRGA